MMAFYWIMVYNTLELIFIISIIIINSIYVLFTFIESFYSVCPEILSYHIAKRCKNLIALDPFCGAGGNIIQLALTCKLGIVKCYFS